MDFLRRVKLKYLLPGGIIFIGVLIFFILMFTRPTTQTVTVKERIWQVKTIPARLEKLAPELTLYGQVETPALVKAAAPSKSRVMSIAVREGDPISKDQLLVSLDPRDYQPKVSQAEARVAELNALIKSERLRHKANVQAFQHEKKLLVLEKSAVKRAQMMKNKKMGSTAALELAQEELERQQLAYTIRKLDLNDHQARIQQLEARLAFAQAELELAQLDMERSQIHAPFDGFVESLQVAEGDHVKANQVLLSYYPSAQLEVRAKIPAAFGHELQQVMLQGESLSAIANIADQSILMKLDRFAGAADATGIAALFSISQGNDLVRLGSTLSLSLQRPIKEQVIAIPFAALYDNNRIYILQNDRLVGIKVELLGEYADKNGQFHQLISSSKIKPDDRIVTTHLPNAITGLRVLETDFKTDTE